MAFKQEVNVPLIFTVGIISGIMLLVIVIGMQAWYQSEEQEELAQKALDYPNQTLLDLQGGQKANIASYHWVDKKHDVVSIPIDLAMQVMLDTNGKLPTTAPSTTEPSNGTGAAH